MPYISSNDRKREASGFRTRVCRACAGGFPIELERAPCCGRMRDGELSSVLLAELLKLRAAALRLVEHAEEVYPHFECERGQRDIAAVRALLGIQP